jgi:hypothetical protein
MIYSWDDPIWKLKPTHQDCRELFCAVVERALYDAKVIDLPETGRRWRSKGVNTIYTDHFRKINRAYVMKSYGFAVACEMAGLDVSAVRKIAGKK